MKVLRLLAVLLLVSCLLPAQSPEPDAQSPSPSAPPLATGTVTGHVYLGDSHLPARMAMVTLLPVVRPQMANGLQVDYFNSSAKEAKSPDEEPSAPTQLDGSFTFRGIPPGKYYVLAETPGYISPIHLPCGMVAALSKEDEDSLSTLLPAFTIVANRATNVEIVLPKGAAISGRVRFDDGERYSEASVVVLHKDKSGKWARYETGRDWRLEDSDDRGNFRIAGLPAGEYLLKVSLEYSNNNDGIDIYYGDVTRLKDAKSIKVKEGEESVGNNIEVPLGKLHSVSGTVVSAETGEMVMAEFVELHDADDDSPVAHASAIEGRGEFRFPYVPEGEYTLKVSGLIMDLHGNGVKPAREYLDASQLIIVHGETSSVTIKVKPKPVPVAAQ